MTLGPDGALRPWRDHLDPGDPMTVADLSAEGTLVRA